MSEAKSQETIPLKEEKDFKNLEIMPADKIIHFATPTDETLSQQSEIILRNLTGTPILFKFRTNHLEAYRIRPVVGVVKPNEKWNIHVHLMAGFHCLPNDQLLILSKNVDDSSSKSAAELETIWQNTSKNNLNQQTIRIVQDGPNTQNSTATTTTTPPVRTVPIPPPPPPSKETTIASAKKEQESSLKIRSRIGDDEKPGKCGDYNCVDHDESEKMLLDSLKFSNKFLLICLIVSVILFLLLFYFVALRAGRGTGGYANKCYSKHPLISPFFCSK